MVRLRFSQRLEAPCVSCIFFFCRSLLFRFSRKPRRNNRHQPQHNFYLGMERINISMTALQQIAIANIGTPGHKNIVWISPRAAHLHHVANERGR